ncbi:MAG: ribulose 1,5-bisphosphate synthetase/thiazole synthase, partial [Myxococcota bacterium]
MVASFSRDNKSTNGRAVNVDPSLTRARRLVRAAGYLSPRLGARVAKRIWERPRNYDMPARESALVASAEKVRIPFGTASLAGCSWGTGPTVLLV